MPHTDTMKPIYQEGDVTPVGIISDVMPLKHGSQTFGFIYELDGDFDRRYTIDELVDLINDK